MTDEIKDVLEALVKLLVNKPDEVKIEKAVDEMGVLLTVKVADEDAGLVIGRQGQTIQAVRTIMRAIGTKSRATLNIKLDVPERPSGERPKEKSDFSF